MAKETPKRELMAGMIGGTLGTLVTMPLDTVAVRQQAAGEPLGETLKNIWRGIPTTDQRRKGIIPRKGIPAFYSGTLFRALKVAPATGVAFAGAEYYRRKIRELEKQGQHEQSSGSEEPHKRFGRLSWATPYVGESAGQRYVRLFEQAQKLDNTQLLEEIDRLYREKAPQEVIPYVFEAKERKLNLPLHIRQRYDKYATTEFLDQMQKAFRLHSVGLRATEAAALTSIIATPTAFLAYMRNPQNKRLAAIAAAGALLGTGATQVAPVIKELTFKAEENLYKGAQKTRYLGKILTRNPEGQGRLRSGKKPSLGRHYAQLERYQREFTGG